jgi:AcrR family transcriptional regulator
LNKVLRSQPTRDRILEHARRLFAEEGYDRTTIRGVAAAAEINPSLVLRYYGSKEGLFAAAASFDLEIPDLSVVPRAELGTTLVRHFLRRWDARGEELPALLKAAVTHEKARQRLFQLFREQVAPALAKVCGAERALLCSALVATQTIGLAFTRNVVRFPPVVALPEELIVERIGATIQAYLTAEAVPARRSPRTRDRSAAKGNVKTK